MPFHVRCDACKQMIAKGVRFNAEKKKGKKSFNLVGKYLSTHIFQFSMRCDMCKNIMVIRTDPEKIDYTLVSGCVKYVKYYLIL
jgi:coiled-coil domain-containing protein 130